MAKDKHAIRKVIFGFGTVESAYRPNLYVEYFFKNNRNYPLTFLNTRVIVKRPKLIRGVWLLTNCVLGVLSADVVLIFPMSHSGWGNFTIRLAHFLRKEIVIDFYISNYSTTVIDRKIFPPTHKMAKKAMRCDRDALAYATKLLFLNEAERSFYCHIAGVSPCSEKIVIAPLAIKERPIAKSLFAKNLSPIPRIAWWGLMGNPIHGIVSIIEAMHILHYRGVRISCTLYGTDNQAYCDHVASAKNLIDSGVVEFRNDASFANGLLQDLLYANCDLALGVLGDTDKAKNVLANKVVEAASMALPIITCFSSATAEFFSHGKSVIFTPPKAEDIADNIERLISDPGLMRTLGQEARKVYEANFSTDSMERTLEILFPLEAKE